MKKTCITMLSLTLFSGTLLFSQPPGQEPLEEPYKPRPTAEPPAGWRIILLENSKVENKIEISPGKEITVGVPAYKLEPTQQENQEIQVVQDPHYNPLLKNAQEKTMGAAITKFSEESEALRENLSEVINTLENSLKPIQKENKTKNQ